MIFPKTTPTQKKAIRILQVGTILEYFDLCLYVHMAVLLNDVFFPKSDPSTAKLLAAFSFCSTWLLRPVGAFLFGKLGDKWGRRSTVVITTSMMSFSCIVMANLPTYDQIGIAAAWGVTICRMLQGISSLGEIVGAQIYLTEITKPPARYTIVSSISGAAGLGGVLALGVATLCNSLLLDWRLAFWSGSIVAVIGALARTKLRETPEFIAAIERKKSNHLLPEEKKLNKKNCLAYFCISCARPFFFFFTYIYAGEILKSHFGLTSQEVIVQNFSVSFAALLHSVILISLTLRFHPIKILNWTGFISIFMVLALPALLCMAQTPKDILYIQLLCVFFQADYTPSEGFMCSKFPVLKRFTSMGILFSLSRLIMFPLSSFGLVAATNSLGYYGIWLIGLPVCAAYCWGVKYYQGVTKIENSYARSFISLEKLSVKKSYT